jgi:hypothetical protein
MVENLVNGRGQVSIIEHILPVLVLAKEFLDLD